MDRGPDFPEEALATPGIRARHRPGGIAAFWTFRLLCAWLLAAPLASALGGTGVAHFPQGDALLFKPGGTYLMEALRLGLGSLAAELQNTVWFALILGYLSLVPMAGLLYALCHGGKLRAGEVLGRAVEQLPSFTFLAGFTLLARAGVVLLGLIVLWVLRASIYDSLNVRSADLCLLGAAGLVLSGVLLVGVIQDLARAALVRHRLGPGSALAAAVRLTRERPLPVLTTWLVPGLWSVAIVAVGALAVGQLHVERAGIGRVLGALALHQLIAVTLVALQAQWLAGALRLVGEPVDPTALHPES